MFKNQFNFLETINQAQDFLAYFWPFITLGSLLMLLSLPLCVVFMPADYFVSKKSHQPSVPSFILRNTVAFILLIAGLLMLFLPGQGILTILLSLIIGEYPGKENIKRKILKSQSLRRGLNSLRKKLGKEPFIWKDSTPVC